MPKPYFLDLSPDSVAATNNLSIACFRAKEELRGRAEVLEAAAAPGSHEAGHARELVEAAAYLFSFDIDRGADAENRNARRLCAAARLFCEYILESTYLAVHYGNRKSFDSRTGVDSVGRGFGLLHDYTAWSAHPATRSPGGDNLRVDGAYIEVTATVMVAAVSALVAADVQLVGDRGERLPLMWQYPEPIDGALFDMCTALNTHCEVLRGHMDKEWWCAKESSLRSARFHVFWFRGHAPKANDTPDVLLDKARRLCLGLRLFAEDVGNNLASHRPAASALKKATTWAAHPHNRRLGKVGDWLTDTIVLGMPLYKRIRAAALSLLEMVTEGYWIRWL